MKNTLFTLLSFAFCVNTFSQDSIVYKVDHLFRKMKNDKAFEFNWRTIVKENDTCWKRADYDNEWNLLQVAHFKDSSLDILHGHYTMFVKFSLGKKIFYEGRYFNNKPVDKWYFYKEKKSAPSDSLDYNFYENLNKEYIYLVEEKDNVLPPEKKIVYPGGEKAWIAYLLSGIYGLEDADEYYGTKREIIISFIIDENGHLKNVYPTTSLNPPIDLQIVKIFRKSKPWLVGKEVLHNVLHIRIQAIIFDKWKKDRQEE